jgi:acetyltransferase-like isoleucine patch superfamily enzyme
VLRETSEIRETGEIRDTMKKTPGLYLKSAMCTAWFRIHGCQTGLIACDGQLPAISNEGTVRVGERFVIRGRVARSEITAHRNGQILIGDRVFLNQGVVIAATESIEIGADTKIGDFSAILDSNYHDLDPAHPDKARPVTIGRNVWLGSGVLVLPGVEIGDHTVVAAKSVVRHSLPAGVLAAGNPAEVVKQLEIPEGWTRGGRVDP